MLRRRRTVRKVLYSAMTSEFCEKNGPAPQVQVATSQRERAASNAGVPADAWRDTPASIHDPYARAGVRSAPIAAGEGGHFAGEGHRFTFNALRPDDALAAAPRAGSAPGTRTTVLPRGVLHGGAGLPHAVVNHRIGRFACTRPWALETGVGRW